MLSERILKKDARVGVFGIGYVGLPLAIKLAEADFSVIGIDINQKLIDTLQDGKSTVEGIKDEKIFEVIKKSGKLSLVKVEEVVKNNKESKLKELMGLDIIVVCVPTPLRRKRGWYPETNLIARAAQLICKICELEAENGLLPDERLVVLESTTYPGTTKEIFSPLQKHFEEQGKKCFLAYSPERTSPGPESHNEDSKENSFQITRIISGIDEDSTNIAKKFYETVFREVYPVSSLETAEMTKLVENTFRFISIGFANELARISKAFGLNVWEIISAVKTKPFGLDICYPGLIGGHCLPIDPHYLAWAYRNHRNVATFVEVAEKSHQDARQDALTLIQRLLSKHDKGLPKSSILFFGIAYKKDVGDIRESGVLDLMKKLLSYGADITFWDPVQEKLEVKQKIQLKFSESEYNQLPVRIADKMERKEDMYVTLPEQITGKWESLKDDILSAKFDCVVLATAHKDFQKAYFELITNDNAPPIVDINNTIESWLKKAKLNSEEINQLSDILNKQHRYMLFGRD